MRRIVLVFGSIPRQPVQSTAIATIGYSNCLHILEIEFVNGAVYRYFDVPVTVYRGPDFGGIEGALL